LVESEKSEREGVPVGNVQATGSVIAVGNRKGSMENGESEEEKLETEKEQLMEKEVGEREDVQALTELEIEKDLDWRDEEEEKKRLGARLQLMPDRWSVIGGREIVEGGVRADWIDGPPTAAVDYTRRERYAGAMHTAMLQAIREELQRGVLEVVPMEEARYVMAAFVVITHKLRLILDCRPINEYIREKSFKMADWLELKRLVRRGDWAVTLDFSAAFHHLGVEEELRRLLNFRYDGRTFRYLGLPFGLRSAPRLFCGAMAATMNAVRARWNVVASAYMDDVIIFHADREVLKKVVVEIVEFVEWLGWTVNKEKSVLEPSREVEYLGVEWSTSAMTVKMTAKKNKKLKTEVKRYIKLAKAGAVVKVRHVAKLIGQLSATRAQHEEASLYLAKLNRVKCIVVKKDGWEGEVELTRAVLPELHWWLETIRTNVPNDIRAHDPTITLYTDASEAGWGSMCVAKPDMAERLMFGWWKVKERDVNCIRELRAVEKAVMRCWMEDLVEENTDILIYTDNTNVEYNLNRKRAGWRMRKEVRTFLMWLKERNIRLECRHIAGEDNKTADALSRLAKSGDYSLRDGVLAKAEAELGEAAEIDLFARSANRQKDVYCTLEKDGRALARNALTIHWNLGCTVLIHPPIPMITRSLLKIRKDRARAVLVIPYWRGMIWQALLNTLTVKGPVMLGRCEDVLQMGPGMRQQRASLPPGVCAAWLVQG
jgi:hypothetical protein